LTALNRFVQSGADLSEFGFFLLGGRWVKYHRELVLKLSAAVWRTRDEKCREEEKGLGEPEMLEDSSFKMEGKGTE